VNSVKGKRVLVSGASGFIGSHLVDRLVREGAIVSALSRTEGQLAAIASRPAVEFIPCDLTQVEQTRNALESFSPAIVYHFAAYPDGQETFERFRNNISSNIESTVNLLEAFRSSGGETFVFGDSTKAYGDSPAPYTSDTPLRPLSSYAIAKAAGWQFCELYRRLYGTNVVSVRPTMIYGPRQNYNLITYVVQAVLSGQSEIPLMGGMQTRDPLYIDDALEAIIAISQTSGHLSGRVINLAGGDEQTVVDIARMIVELMGSTARIVPRADQARPTDTTRSSCDNAEAKLSLNWEPHTSLREGLQRTIQSLVPPLKAQNS
jgi:nucleoside-diphosphate-sugar epimerase